MSILRGDALTLPLADNSVDLVVTSPPYFGLRSYQDGGEHYAGQIGDEPTPTEFVDALIAATAEMVRVVKPSGSIFVNLGDKYAQRSAGLDGRNERTVETRTPTRRPQTFAMRRDGWEPGALREKSLMLIPERYRIRCIDELGLIARAVIVWSKPNGLPESVTDRVRRSHEDWVHFTLSPRYYSAVDEIREPHELPRMSRSASVDRKAGAVVVPGNTAMNRPERTSIENNPLGKLPGSVWTIPTEPLQVPDHLDVDHFAAFPTEWPRRIIQGWSPRGICVECGEGRRPVAAFDWPHDLAPRRVLTTVEVERAGRLFTAWQDARGVPTRAIAVLFPSRTGGLTGCVQNWRTGANVLTPEQAEVIESHFGPLPSDLSALVHKTELLPVRGGNFGATGRKSGGGDSTRFTHTQPPTRKVTGEACACSHPTAPTRPGVVLDPFGGTGTTTLVADALGRHGISLDMSADYCRLAGWRTTDPKQRAKAARRDYTPPPEQTTGQLDLWEGLLA